MHNSIVELQGKCRRLFYAKVDIMALNSEPGDEPDFKAGDILGIASGGGTIELLTGNELIIATFNDHTAPSRRVAMLLMLIGTQRKPRLISSLRRV